MIRMTTTRRWALSTIVLASGFIVVSIATSSRTEDMLSRTSPAIETVTSVPFSKRGGAVLVTEPLAHVRFPAARPLVGKKLTLDISFEPVTADVVEVGVRQGDFWLDYERLPLFNRALETLARDGSGWRVLRGTRETIFINSRTQSTASSVAEFLRDQPTSGMIGLFGNTTLAQPHVRTAPFRIGDTPDAFAAIYAAYVPLGIERTIWTRTVTVPLTTAFQHPDGAFDIMLFTNMRSGAPPLIRVTAFRAAIAPAWPDPQDLRARLTGTVRRALFRSPIHP